MRSATPVLHPPTVTPSPSTTQRGMRGWVILLKRGVLPVDPMKVASTPS